MITELEEMRLRAIVTLSILYAVRAVGETLGNRLLDNPRATAVALLESVTETVVTHAECLGVSMVRADGIYWLSLAGSGALQRIPQETVEEGFLYGMVILVGLSDTQLSDPLDVAEVNMQKAIHSLMKRLSAAMSLNK